MGGLDHAANLREKIQPFGNAQADLVTVFGDWDDFGFPNGLQMPLCSVRDNATGVG